MAWLNTDKQAMSNLPCERCWTTLIDRYIWLIEGMTMFGDKFSYYKRLCEICLHALYKLPDEEVYRSLKG